MDRYLREKSELRKISRQGSMTLHQKFYTDDYVRRLHDWRTSQAQFSESLEIAEVSDTSAKIITTDLSGKTQRRYRYHLAFASETWKITNQERECFFCHGIGKTNGVVCKNCNGEGWSQLYQIR